MIASVSAQNLSCRRGLRPVFAGLNFRVQAGECVAIEGPNGAGKSSLLRMLAGFITPQDGTLQFAAEDGAQISDEEERGKQVGWLGHQDAVKPQLTARENLTFFAQLYSDVSCTEAALDCVGLTRQRDLPGQYLSAGQKKRLALARLLVSRRPVWLMDEPLAALDVNGKALAAKLIHAHVGSGGIVFAATHEPLGTDAMKLSLGAA